MRHGVPVTPAPAYAAVGDAAVLICPIIGSSGAKVEGSHKNNFIFPSADASRPAGLQAFDRIWIRIDQLWTAIDKRGIPF